MTCFDKRRYSETANDIYDAGVNYDYFATLDNSNKECHVAAKTPWGTMTERKTLNNIQM